jgi:hypothetical protein
VGGYLVREGGHAVQCCVLHFSEEENDVVLISMRKYVQDFCCYRSIFSAHSAIKSSTAFFCTKEVGSMSLLAMGGKGVGDA